MSRRGIVGRCTMVAAAMVGGLWTTFGGGCGVREVTCEELSAWLLPCDLRPMALVCDRLAPHEQQELLERFEDDECAGLREEPGGEVDPRACRAFDWDCPPPLGPPPMQVETRYPLVFVGGVDARSAFDWNPELLTVLAEQGVEVHHVRMPGWAPVPQRAEALWTSIEALQSNAARVNLVCYAVAGLDCRFVTSPGGLFAGDEAALSLAAQRIATVTTIATPHRGTAVANTALSLMQVGASNGILGALLGEEREGAGGANDEQIRQTLDGLTNERVLAFNRQVVDSPDVMYQSWAGISHVGGQSLVPSASEIERFCRDSRPERWGWWSPELRDSMSELLWTTAPFSTRTLTEGGLAVSSPADGMVSVLSAQWGEFLGCVPADHYDVIGQFGDLGPDPQTGFDAARFYLTLASDLAGRGF